MEISLTKQQEASDLAQAITKARQVRQWQRYRAIQLLWADLTQLTKKKRGAGRTGPAGARRGERGLGGG